MLLNEVSINITTFIFLKNELPQEIKIIVLNIPLFCYSITDYLYLFLSPKLILTDMTKKKRVFTFKRILIALLLIFILIQFFRIDKTNPESDPSKDFITITNPPDEIKDMLKESCYDCHSHESKYPWYTNIAPISWWVKHHINEGREHLNFSIWGDYSEKKANHKLEECYEEVEEGEMPMSSYLIMHSHAGLSEQEIDQMVEWFKSIGNFEEEDHEGEDHDD